MSVAIGYNGYKIAELTESGGVTLATSGKYCQGNVEVHYEARSRSYEITLPKSTGWTLLAELDEDVLAHINDPTLVVTLINTDEYEYDQYARRAMYATNIQIGIVNNKYPVYGNCSWQTSETMTSHQPVYYPPNKTDEGLGTGGNAAFRVSEGKYYVTCLAASLQAGTWRLTFVW